MSGVEIPVTHLVQRAGLPGERLKPAGLRTRPPTPANGAAQSLQRGGDGICRNARRRRARPALSPVKTERTSSRVISFVSAMGPIYAWIEQRSSYGWPAAT
jgi:hypothetical protein